MLKTVVVFQTVVVGFVSVLLALMSQPPARGQTAPSVAALKALTEAQSKVDCTFALQMKEVDPDADPDIHVPAPPHGDAKIRRIQPLPCRAFTAVQGERGSLRTKMPKADDEVRRTSEKPAARER